MPSSRMNHSNEYDKIKKKKIQNVDVQFIFKGDMVRHWSCDIINDAANQIIKIHIPFGDAVTSYFDEIKEQYKK